MPNLAIITTHPIQYNAPLFRLLAQEQGVDVKVFYTWSQRQTDHFDRAFGVEIKWDIPLLDGYEYEFVENTSKQPGSHHYKGIINPTLIKKLEDWQVSHILVYGWKFHSHYRVMKHFRGKAKILFRGDSTLLDYDHRKWGDLFKRNHKEETKSNSLSSQERVEVRSAIGYQLSAISHLLKFKLRRQLLKHVYKKIDIALYVGTANKEYFMEHGLTEEQLVFAPHAIENERFFDNEQRKYEEKAAAWRKELGYNKNDIVILFAGKLESKKNPELLLKAVQSYNNTLNNAVIARRSNDDEATFSNLFLSNIKNADIARNEVTKQPLKLLITGNGPLEEKLKKLASNDSNIQFLPFQNQTKMPLVYRLGDIFCLPSQGPNETWGLAVNEAMACNRPVIVSNKAGCSADMVDAGKTGWVIDGKHGDDLERIWKELNKNNVKNMVKFLPDKLNLFTIFTIKEQIVKTLLGT